MIRAGLAFALLFVLGTGARADFSLWANASGATGDINSVIPLATTGTVTIGGTPITYHDGGVEVTTPGGALVYFLNAITPATTSAASAETIYVAAPHADTEVSNITFSANYTVSGPGSGTFSAPMTLTVAPSATNGSTAFFSNVGGLGPKSQVIGADTFTETDFRTQSGAVNDGTAPLTVTATIVDAPGAAVPEPSSLALCGAGLAVGLATLVRRRAADVAGP